MEGGTYHVDYLPSYGGGAVLPDSLLKVAGRLMLWGDVAPTEVGSCCDCTAALPSAIRSGSVISSACIDSSTVAVIEVGLTTSGGLGA